MVKSRTDIWVWCLLFGYLDALVIYLKCLSELSILDIFYLNPSNYGTLFYDWNPFIYDLQYFLWNCVDHRCAYGRFFCCCRF